MLMIHDNSKLVTAAALNDLPIPHPRGTMHQPVPHATLVQALKHTALANGYRVKREQLALGRKGARLFGVMDLEAPPTVERSDLRGFAIGFRNSTDESLAIRLVAGVRVTVCDNLCLAGDMIALSRKNTSGLDLEAELGLGFNRYIVQASSLEHQIGELSGTPISDDEAKIRIFDIFNEVLPPRLWPVVAVNYFVPDEARPDCFPRTLFSLHNACTRAIKLLPPVRAFAANVDLGRVFGLTNREVH